MFIQPTRQITFNLDYIESTNFNLLDDWLTTVLKIDIEHDDNPTRPIKSMINRNLLIIRSLFQSILMPYFDLGTILKIEQDLKIFSKWTITLSIAKIDYIPDRCYQIIIKFTLQLVNWMIKNPKTTKNIEYLYSLIQTQVINQLKDIGGSGKSTISILRTAHQQNIPFLHLGGGVYQLGWGVNSRLIERSTNDLDSAIGARMSDNKMITSYLVRMAGLPAPDNGSATNVKDAIKVAHYLKWPVVVKPIDADRGEGVTIGVTNDEQLISAFEIAKQFSKSKQVIVEREVTGIVHRIFIVNGKLLYAVKRLPKSIEGDGQKQVSELIKEANQLLKNTPPWLRTEIFPDDDEAVKAMMASGFSLNSVPKDKEFVPLRMIESTASGGGVEEVTTSIHPDNLDISIRASKLFGLNIAGIDIISTDITKPWHENGAIINEVNYAPSFGANEISKSYIPDFFKHIIVEDGRIPISVMIGGNKAMEVAIQQQKIQIKNGVACYLSSHKITLDASTNEMIFPFKSIYKRSKALLLNRQVESIILIIQTDEFLHTGLPMDQISQITTVDQELPQDRYDTLHNFLQGYSKE